MQAQKHRYWQQVNRFIDQALSEIMSMPKNCLHLLHGYTGEKCAIRRAPKPCKNCGANIMCRSHSEPSRRYAHSSTVTFHDWVANDCDRLDLYADAPAPTSFEQYHCGLGDEHLKRIEQYWSEHQMQASGKR